MEFMANLDRLTPLLEARKSFDKQALLEIHVLIRQQMEAAEDSSLFLIPSNFSGSSGKAYSIPLERLKPISLTHLQVWNINQGRVLYGTLCAEAYWMGGIMTVLEDDNGLAVRLAIFNVPHSQTNMEKLYPKGAKVAIKEPYMHGLDVSSTICVYSADVEMLVTQNEKRADEERKKGNSCLREEQWDAAAEHYTNCIDAVLLLVENGSANDNNNMNTLLLHAYSNRAETRLQVKKFELALEDSNKALLMDAGNLMALYRKGRALVGLGQYAAACRYLERASNGSPGQKKVQDVLRQAKTLYSHSRIYEHYISEFPPDFVPNAEFGDFAGPVEIKMTEDGRGRGLYATREIFIGQLLVVCDAVAITYEDERSASPTASNVDHGANINMASHEDLVTAVVFAAKKSQILLRQLYSLEDYSVPGSLDVPAIDLLKSDGQMSGTQEEEKGKLVVNVNRIRDIVSRNSFVGAEPKMHEAKLGQNYSGLWLLPSFINHSCLPNSSRVKVGSVMSIHASKPINSGEEITISYFDTLVPLPQRQAMCQRWGFECKCRRCILELSMKADLEPITARFQELHDKALEEISGATSQERSDAHLPACAEFSKLFEETQEIIRNSALLEAQEEKNWIRASFVSAYLPGTPWDNFFTVPYGQEVMDAIQNTVPGDIRTLVIVEKKLEEAKDLMGDESQAFITQCALAREACIRVFGRHSAAVLKHSADVLKALVLQHSNCHREDRIKGAK